MASEHRRHRPALLDEKTIWNGRYRSIVDLEAHLHMKAYETCLSATSTTDAPWHVVPADDKKNARLIIFEIVLDMFSGLKMAYPEPTAKRRRELQLIRKTLVK